MADYPPNEIVDMIRILGEARNNYTIAERIYVESFPDRRHPNRTVIKRLCERARQGTLKRIRPKSGPNEVTSQTVLGTVFLNPQVSTRQIEKEQNIPKSTANRVLKAYKFHPYHINLTQKLVEGDFQRRLRFCNWARDRIRENPRFFSEVLFSDEATFCNRGGVNKHNCHYYLDVNPHWQRSQEFQRQWSINVWAGILGDVIVGPYFFEENLTAANYLTFLRNDLFNLLRHVDNNVRNRIWIQQDGAPAHRSRAVTEYLNERFPNRWIGMGSRIQEWPARSPDLTPLDFYLWGYIKGQVYSEEPTTVENMKDRIREACRNINVDVLRKVMDDFQHRLDLCIQVRGQVFEHLK